LTFLGNSLLVTVIAVWNNLTGPRSIKKAILKKNSRKGDYLAPGNSIDRHGKSSTQQLTPTTIKQLEWSRKAMATAEVALTPNKITKRGQTSAKNRANVFSVEGAAAASQK
jgi:hypothetical protein